MKKIVLFEKENHHHKGQEAKGRSYRFVEKMGSRYSIEQRWDAVVWMGDFNSRIEEFKYHRLDNEKSIFEAIKRSDYDILSHHD